MRYERNWRLEQSVWSRAIVAEILEQSDWSRGIGAEQLEQSDWTRAIGAERLEHYSRARSIQELVCIESIRYFMLQMRISKTFLDQLN